MQASASEFKALALSTIGPTSPNRTVLGVILMTEARGSRLADLTTVIPFRHSSNCSGASIPLPQFNEFFWTTVIRDRFTTPTSTSLINE